MVSLIFKFYLPSCVLSGNNNWTTTSTDMVLIFGFMTKILFYYFKHICINLTENGIIFFYISENKISDPDSYAHAHPQIGSLDWGEW